MTRAGIVAFAGMPNVGKSTLLNRIVGQKLAITSPKPESTRQRVVGLHTAGDVQMIVFDTPGLLDPTYPLQAAMRSAAVSSLRDADVIVHLADAREGMPAALASLPGLAPAIRAPVLVALNKADLLSPSERAALTQAGALLLSARTGEGVPALLEACAQHLPASPFLYPEDDLSTHSQRFIVAELVREAAFEQLGEEVPYSVACVVEEFREDRSPLYIRAVLYVERESQKRILIGAKGQQIRALGQAARRKVEGLVGQPVYLDLWVKVLSNWRRNPAALARLGLVPEESQ